MAGIAICALAADVGVTALLVTTAAALGVDATPLPRFPGYDVCNAANTAETAVSATLTGPRGAAIADAVAGRVVTFCVDVEGLGFGLAVALAARGPACPPADAAAEWPAPESSVSAHATAFAEAKAAPIPSAMAKPPTRPIYADAIIGLVYGTRPCGEANLPHIDRARHCGTISWRCTMTHAWTSGDQRHRSRSSTDLLRRTDAPCRVRAVPRRR
ncbi:exported hypothetical protein [uncultured Mycobacterium sp.]|uniref:Uncharacterized protein n=1 Tax=uncultured Mycobacterium sp. TaxID=171292 RepID=A0A1Y5PMF7_9MYCO|nr:exported hypothetical protein [uncultured Mycobacterium sp.]